MTPEQMEAEKAHREAGAALHARRCVIGIRAESYRTQLVDAYGLEWWDACSAHCRRVGAARRHGGTIARLTPEVLEAERVAVEAGAIFLGRAKALRTSDPVYAREMRRAYGWAWWHRMRDRNILRGAQRRMEART